MHSEFANRLRAWKEAQREWPQTLYCGERAATVEDCNAWLVDLGQLQQLLARQLEVTDVPLVDSQSEPGNSTAFYDALESFRRRVIIHRGDLLSDSFKCSLGECG